MPGATNPLDQVDRYVGLISKPDPERRIDPPDGSTINGRAAVDAAEEALIAEARAQERARCAATVAGIGWKGARSG